MKKLLLVLLCLLMLSASAEELQQTITTADGLTVSCAADPSLAATDAELLVQHYYTLGEYEAAFALNSQLAEMGDTQAVYRLGCQYLNGLGTAQDETAALECFTRAKASGCREAALALCLARLNGWGMPQDAPGAVEELTGHARQGLFRNELALLYLHGAYDVPAQEEMALYWFDRIHEDLLKTINRYTNAGASELAAEYQAQYDGMLADFRLSDPEDLFRYPSVQLSGWESSGVQARVGLALGRFWAEGRGGVTDLAAAAHWYEFTTTFNEEPMTSAAYAALADMYLNGSLGAVDAQKAAEYFLLDTADGGYGAYRVGRMYWDGVTGADGTVYLAPDTETALSLFGSGGGRRPCTGLCVSGCGLPQRRTGEDGCVPGGALFRAGTEQQRG